jgi:very-short-patch-repair endonuclease
VLRKTQTDAERKLWRALHAIPLEKAHFRKQVPLGRYIADFACHRARLVVEVDGGQHNSTRGLMRDGQRDRWLESQGYLVLRFWNHEVLKETDVVMSRIADVLEKRLAHLD